MPRWWAPTAAAAGGSSAGDDHPELHRNFSITFSVTAASGNNWAMTLEVLRVGAQTIISDGREMLRSRFGALTGGESGAGRSRAAA